MLSAKAIKSVKQASHYFFEQDNYYLKDAPEQSAQWWGAGAEKLGLLGDVDKDKFTQLLQGQLPSGQQLGKRVEGEIKHRPGFDLTFSAPKSVSILAEIGKDTRLKEAHTQAVQETLRYVQQMCAQARTTLKGKTQYEDTHNLVVAQFLHDTSRQLDPQLHTHCVVLNMTQRQDGQWRALASNTPGMSTSHGFLERVFENQRFLGGLYRAHLAFEVQKLGYTVEKTHADGRFEIAEVPKEVLTHFSQRREAIDKFMEARGLQGARASSYATLETRQSKQQIDRQQLHEQWQARAQTLNFDAKSQVVQSTLRHPAVSTEHDTVAEQAVQYAIDHLLERDTTLSHHRLLNIAVTHAIGHTTPSHIIDAMNRAVIAGDLIPLVTHEKEVRYITQTLLGYEHDMLRQLSEQAYSVLPITTTYALKERAQATLLNQNQQTALVGLFDTHDRCMALEGPSGTGKTWMIANIVAMAETFGWQTLVLTPSTAAAKALTAAGLSTQTVSGFIQAAYKALALKEAKPLQKRYLVIDDASMLSAKQLRDVQRLSQQLDNRLILIGDNKAYLPIEGGSPFTQLQKAGLKTLHLTEILRQRDTLRISAIQDTLSGDIKTAFEKMRNRLITIDETDDRLRSMAHHYSGLSSTERQNTLLLLPTRAQCEAVNLEVRQHLQEEIHSENTFLKVLNPKPLTMAETTSARHYMKGDVVRFNQAQKKLAILAGDYYTVLATNATTNHVTLQNSAGTSFDWNPLTTGGKRKGAIEVFIQKNLAVSVGETLRWSRNHRDTGLFNGERVTVLHVSLGTIKLERQDKQHLVLNLSLPESRHFDYGYALTPHQSYYQAPHHIITHQMSQTALTTQRSFYKQLSQAKDSVWFYTDDAERYCQTVQKQTGDRLGAMEAVLNAAGKTIIIDPQYPPKTQVKQWTDSVAQVLAHLDTAAFQINKSPEQHAFEAVNYAMQHLAEREAAFTHPELLQTALTHALGQAHPKHVEEAIQALKRNGLLIAEQQTWTTREAIALEQAILDTAKAGKNQVTPILEPQQLEAYFVGNTLTQGQKAAVELITTTSDTFVLVQGYAGTGKTAMLQAAQQVLADKVSFLQTAQSLCEKQGFKLHGLAPSHTAVEELSSRGIPAQTLDSFLVEIQRETTDYSQTVFILDEASMVSSRKYQALQTFALTHKVRIAALGDTKQLSAIEAGKPFALAQKSGLATAVMTEIKRQRNNPTLLSAVKSTYQGDFAKSFERLSTHHTDSRLPTELTSTKKSPLGICEIPDKDERLVRIAEDYLNRTPERRARTLIITPANSDRVYMNSVIREGLREEGILKGDDKSVKILVARNFTEVERTRVTNYTQGDIVRFNQSMPSLQVEKNSYLHVIDIDKTRNLLTLENERGQPILWQPHQLSGRRGSVEIYEQQERDVSVGDSIRFTRSNKAASIYANTIGHVVTISDTGLVTIALGHDKTVSLDTTQPLEQHLEHSYAITTYAAQGKTKQEVLYHQESFQKHLASQKDFLVATTRAELTVTLYTDNKNDLLQQIQQHTGDKRSALETINFSFAEKVHSVAHSKALEPPHIIKQPSRQQPTPKYDVLRIEQRLIENAEAVAEHLLGKPDKVTATAYRYGSHKGSLVVTLKGEKRGSWYDFQTGEGGNLLSLIGKMGGYSSPKEFVKTLEYAAKLTGAVLYLDEKPKTQIPRKTKNIAFTEYQKQRITLAQKIEKESFPIQGTLAEQYLREHRGITCSLPDSLRFHSGIYIPALKQRFPALIVIAKNVAGKTQAVQAIFLDRTTAKKAAIETNKIMIGPIKNTLVTLQEGEYKDSMTLIAEGVETGLSLKMADRNAQIKVTLGVSNFLNILPSQVNQKVVFCLDNDGQKSMSNMTSQRAMQKLSEVDKVVFYNQPDQHKNDYNDMLKKEGIHAIQSKIESSKLYRINAIDSTTLKQFQAQEHQAKLVIKQHPQIQNSVNLDNSSIIIKQKNHKVTIEKDL